MSKINAAESLRGLACLAVVLSHLSMTFYPYLHNFDKLKSSGNATLDTIHNLPLGFLYSGTAAVFVFFVLSGYVLSYAILSKNNVPSKIKSMTLKRYPRLAIPAGVSCMIAYLVTFYSVDTSKIIGTGLKKYVETHTTFLHAMYEGFIGSFLFGYTKLNSVLWTMQIELLASFLLFALLYIFYINKKAFLIASLILPASFILISPIALLGAYSFVFGAWLYLYGKKIPTWLAVILLITGLYFAGAHETSSSYQVFAHILKDKTYTFLNFLAGFLIVISVLKNETISNKLNKTFLVKLGTLSFSIYLLHMPLIYIIAIPAFNMLLNISSNYLISAFIASLILLITVFWVAYFYSKYIDQLAIKIANKIEAMVNR